MIKKKDSHQKKSDSMDVNIEADRGKPADKSFFAKDKPADAQSKHDDKEVAAVQSLKDKINTLEEALEAAQKATKEQKDNYIALYADMENKQRRHKLDLEKAHKYGLERMASDLIEIVDNLERAYEAFADNKEVSLGGLKEGVHLTLSQFVVVLKKHGVQPVEVEEGQTFNPELHEAVSMQQDKKSPPNTVLKLIQKGYLINGRLLRAARVVVSTG